MMGLNGLSAILAALGGVAYIVVVVGSILFGKRIEATAEPKAAPRAAPAVATYGSAGTINIPGTIVLVAVFFTRALLLRQLEVPVGDPPEWTGSGRGCPVRSGSSQDEGMRP
jgi:hypothetical protein